MFRIARSCVGVLSSPPRVRKGGLGSQVDGKRISRRFDLPAAGCVPSFPLKDLAQRSSAARAFRGETDIIPERASLVLAAWLVLSVDNMKTSLSGREPLNGAPEPGLDLPEIDVFDVRKSV